MPDPAVEAAQRALTNIGYGRSGHVQRVAAAREALKPVREWHRRMADSYALDDRPEGVLVQAVLQELAPLIYTTEELDR